MAKLVKMEKDGEQLDIHPANVKAHEQLGWKVVGSPAEGAAPEDSSTADAKKAAAEAKAAEKKAKADAKKAAAEAKAAEKKAEK